MNIDKKIDLILEFIKVIKENTNIVSEFNPSVEWISVSEVANEKGLTSDAVRKQLESGEFDEGVDFKKPNGKILIHQGAIKRIRRKRRS